MLYPFIYDSDSAYSALLYKTPLCTCIHVPGVTISDDTYLNEYLLYSYLASYILVEGISVLDAYLT